MDFRDCSLDIYKYDKKYIFFGALKLYIKMYKSIMPGVFSEPILAIKEDCSIEDRKSTRLNSSHGSISYAVFCLKKKKQIGRAHV